MNLSPFPREKGESKPSTAYPEWVEEKGRDRFQDLIESDLTAVDTCDSTGVITYYNALAAEFWGRKPEIGDTDERFCGSHMLYRGTATFCRVTNLRWPTCLPARFLASMTPNSISNVPMARESSSS